MIDVIVQKKIFGEDKHVEFKAEIPKKHEKFLKDIIAFANTSGGKTIVGVEDETGKVVGLGDQNPFKLKDGERVCRASLSVVKRWDFRNRNSKNLVTVLR